MDEHEALIEYSEMTTFDFTSKEFQEVRRDYLECKDMVSRIMRFCRDFVSGIKLAKEF